MNLVYQRGETFSITTILFIVISLLASTFSGALTPLISADNSELQQNDEPFHAGKAAGDWVSSGVASSGSSIGGSPATSASVTDGNGDTYLTGFALGDLTFGSLSITNSGQDVYVAKIDSQGVWQYFVTAPTFGGGGWSSGQGIDVDNAGNVYVTGMYGGNVSFGNYQLVSTTDANGDDSVDIFVAKMDPTGNWIWAIGAGGPYDSDSGKGIVVDGLGGVYVTGALNITGTFGVHGASSQGFTDAFVGHVDGNGSWKWVTTAGGANSDDGSGIEVDSTGDLRIVGGFSGSGQTGAQFGSQTFNAVGSSDVFVSKVSSTGSWVWTEVAGASGDIVLPWSFTIDSSDAVYVGGLYGGTASFGQSQISATASSNNGYISKMDNTGVWQWAKTSNGSGVHFIGGLDWSTNGIAFSGGASSGASTSVSFGGSTITGQYFEMIAGVIDTGGNFLWANGGGGAGDDGYYGYGVGGVGWTPAGDVVAVGSFCSGMSSSCTATYGSNTVSVTPSLYNTNYGLPPGVAVWKQASDADGDGIGDSSDNCPMISNSGQEDMDGDNLGNVCDDDADGDGLLNAVDNCNGPAVNWNSSVWADDIDMDGCRDIDEDDDDDEDGILDSSDVCTGASFKLNWTSNVVNDNDMDGCHDSEEDNDDDNDGINDTAGDNCPRGYANWGVPDGNGGYNHNSSSDYDADGCADEVEDEDDDNDGVNDFDSTGSILDKCPTGMLGWISSASLDYDGDGCRDSDEDWDDDNDGVNDVDSADEILDLCSPGATGWLSDATTDRDGDGCRDLDEDDDDDGDGIIDTADGCFVQAGWISTPLTDHDGDGCRDMDEDDNDDNDPVYDVSDVCDKGEIGWVDTDFDGDGCRDESEDSDDDNDGICDDATSVDNVCSTGPDVCPETPVGEDINAEGCGRFTQVDTDGDGIFDGLDICPQDAAADGFDDDLNGCTDDSDGDGITDEVDVFPEDQTQWYDRDGDGRGDNAGQLNSDDCPDTPSEWVWNVPNGTLGCAWEELDDDSDEVLNGLDNCPDSDAMRTVDSNGCSEWQKDDDSDGVMNADDSCADTGSEDSLIETTGCSHEQRLAQGDVNAYLKEYGVILGGVAGLLVLSIVAMFVMLVRRKKGSGMDAWDADTAQMTAGGYVAGQPAAPAPLPALGGGQTVAASYAELPAGGNYVTDAAGGTWYNSPDGAQWAMQGDGSFIKN